MAKFGRQNPSWKGGKRKWSNGYIAIYMPQHPMATIRAHGRPTYILEHRLVMSNYLGRLLNKDEVVHHKNGIRDDNRIENLELTNASAHIIKHNADRVWTKTSIEKLKNKAKVQRRNHKGRFIS